MLTRRDQPEVATRLLAAAATLRARTHAPLQVYVEQETGHQRALTALRARLGRAQFAACWGEIERERRVSARNPTLTL